MMNRYRTLLFATDLTPNAAYAGRHALLLARNHQARVHVLHVLPAMDAAVVNYVGTVMGEQQLTDLELAHKGEVEQALREQYRELVQAELADRPEAQEWLAGIEVHTGSPVAEILACADRLAADLIVIGSHGKGRLQYAFLGSVAEKLLRKTRRPVLIVPLDG